MSPQSVTLRWSPPASSSSEYGEPCPVQKYMIRLRQHGVRKSRAWKLEPDRLSVSLHDLRPGTEYQVSPSVTTIPSDKKVKVVDLYSASTRRFSKALMYRTRCQGITQFHLHTLRFIPKRNEPYLPLPSQPQLVLIY